MTKLDKRLSLIRLFLKNSPGEHDQQDHTPKEDLGGVRAAASPVSSLFSRTGTKYSTNPLSADKPAARAAGVAALQHAQAQAAATAEAAKNPTYASPGKIRNKPKKTKQPKGKVAKPLTQAEKDKEADRRRESEKVRNWKPLPIIPGGLVPSDKLPPKEKTDISAIAAKYIPPGVNDRLNPQTSANLMKKLESVFQQGMAGDTGSMKEALGILEAYAQLNGQSPEKFSADREIVYDSTANALLESKPGDIMADAAYYEFDKLFGEVAGGKPSPATIAHLSGNLQRLYSLGLNIKPVRRMAGHSKPQN